MFNHDKPKANELFAKDVVLKDIAAAVGTHS
jgi:hypothetical protein